MQTFNVSLRQPNCMVSDDPTSSPRPVSPFNRTVQHDAKRTAILSQAAKLFNYKGSRATTLRDIAESLGLTKISSPGENKNDTDG